MSVSVDVPIQPYAGIKNGSKTSDMSMHLNGEIDQDKMLPMEEIEMRTEINKRRASKKPRKTSTKTASRKRCKKGSQRNKKTKRCNKKCLPKQKRNPKTRRCVLRKT